MSMNQPHRAPSQFNQGAGDDQKIANMLALYQSPATVRDLKQTFFYIGVNSNITRSAPNALFYNKTILPAGGTSADNANRFVRSTYYAPIGTTRRMDIGKYINDLLDIRVPKDKYFIELNMVECTIEADSSGWTQIPDRVLRTGEVGPPELGLLNAVEEPTYTYQVAYPVAPTVAPTGSAPGLSNLTTQVNEATKLSAPQTLYCRIRECSNGEPYNWAVTNSGQFSQDKSHQVVIRHSDINVSELTLEYGHMAFKGVDKEYKDIIANGPFGARYKTDSIVTAGPAEPTQNSNKSDQPVYLDYNQEYFNQLDTDFTPDTVYPSFYKGIFQFPNTGTTSGDMKPAASNIHSPANRPPFWQDKKVVASTGEPIPPPDVSYYNIQGKPFFYNQQVSKLNFRILVKIIHMF